MSFASSAKSIIKSFLAFTRNYEMFKIIDLIQTQLDSIGTTNTSLQTQITTLQATSFDYSGTATMVSGTIDVTLSGVTATSQVLATWTGAGTLAGRLSAVGATGKITIASTTNTDTAVVRYFVKK